MTDLRTSAGVALSVIEALMGAREVRSRDTSASHTLALLTSSLFLTSSIFTVQ